MKGFSTLSVVSVILASIPTDSLLVKNVGDKVQLHLASRTADPGTANASELAQSAQEPSRAIPCSDGECTFLANETTGFKTLAQQQKKEIRKLKNKVKKQKKRYLRKHSETEYELLVQQAKLDALKAANEEENGNGAGPEQGG